MDEDDVEMDGPLQRTIQTIRHVYEQIQEIPDPCVDPDAWQMILDSLNLSEDGKNVKAYGENDVTLKNLDAILFAARRFFDTMMGFVVELKKYDPQFQLWLNCGGPMETPTSSDPDIIKMLDVLLMWPFVAMKYIQSARVARMCTDRTTYDDVRTNSPMNMIDRYNMTQHMRTMISDRKQKATHIIMSSLLLNLRENGYVVHNEKVWRRRMVEKEVVLTVDGQRICRECGKPEAEHTLDDVASRKPCVFVPMTMKVDSDTEFDSHTYEVVCTMEKFIYENCGPMAHDLWTLLMEDKGAGQFVMKVLLKSDWAPGMNIRRGFFSFRNGLFDVETNRFFPYTCQCHDIWHTGVDRGFSLRCLPRKRAVTKRTTAPEKDVWLFPNDDNETFDEFNLAPDDGAPTYCQNCGTGCAPKHWVAQKMLPGFFDRSRYWSQMRGEMVNNMEDIKCVVCGECYDHECHHPECVFQPSETDFRVCATCGRGIDDPCHHPECKMWFSESPFTNLVTLTGQNEKCMSCLKGYDECGCTMFMPFDFVPEAPRNITHPALSSVFFAQEIPDPVIDFYLMMIARTMLDPQKYDGMQLFMFILGPAGNGKTTMIDLITSFFHKGDTASIGNNAQEQFPLEQCVDKMTGKTKLLTYFGEIKRNCKVDATHFQKMADCEKNYPFNIKGATIIHADIRFSLWIAGTNSSPAIRATHSRGGRR